MSTPSAPRPNGFLTFVREKSPLLLFGALAAIMIHWTANGAEEHLKQWIGDAIHSPLFYGGCLLAALGCSLAVWRMREKHRELKDRLRVLARNQAVQTTAKERKCASLILFVSPQNIHLLKERPAINGPVTLKKDDQSLKLERNLDNDIASLANSGFSGWNWEPLLRSIKEHRDHLQHIWLLGSAGEKGSFPQGEIARDFLRGYLPDIASKIECYGRALAFEDVEALADELRHIIKSEAERFPLPDICVDVTGGQKTTSIAGVLATLKTPVVNQYVQTGKKREVLMYDLRFESPLELAGDH